MAERDPLHLKILQADERYGLFGDAKSALVGVSGGQDSVALLHALAAMDELPLRLGVAHLHHGMRAEAADGDQEYVEDLARDLGVVFYPEWRDVLAEGERDGMNAEQSGRRARYSLYARVMAEGNFDRIATGHTGTDRAETLLLNLFRGAGLDGMRSIPPRRGRIIRPLIGITRDETEAYCVRHGLPYRTDLTNLQPEYARRNALRLEILPQVKEMFPEAERALIRACETIEEEIEWTDPLLSEWLAEATESMDLAGAVLSTDRLAEMPAGALYRVLRMALEQTRGDLLEVSREQIERVGALVQSGDVGSEIELPGGWIAKRGYKDLTLERAAFKVDAGTEAEYLAVPGSARLEERAVLVSTQEALAPEDLGGDPMTAWVCADVTREGLVLRSWSEGERFGPLGMKGTKKLSDFFTDEKIPQAERERIAVVARPDGEILWIVGHRVSEAGRVASGEAAVKMTARVDETG